MRNQNTVYPGLLAGLATFTMSIASSPSEAIFTCPAQLF